MAREYPETVSMRMTPLEKAALYAAARADGVPVSRMLRTLVVVPLAAQLLGPKEMATTAA